MDDIIALVRGSGFGAERMQLTEVVQFARDLRQVLSPMLPQGIPLQVTGFRMLAMAHHPTAGFTHAGAARERR